MPIQAWWGGAASWLGAAMAQSTWDPGVGWGLPGACWSSSSATAPRGRSQWHIPLHCDWQLAGWLTCCGHIRKGWKWQPYIRTMLLRGILLSHWTIVCVFVFFFFISWSWQMTWYFEPGLVLQATTEHVANFYFEPNGFVWGLTAGPQLANQ